MQNPTARKEAADPQAIIDNAQKESDALIAQAKSVILGTCDTNNRPEASYAPYYMDDENNLYVYLSAMSRHYGNLKANPAASALFIEDESTSKVLFARKRLTLETKAEVITRDSGQWQEIMAKFKDRFGPIIGTLADMTDFDLFKLTPASGNLVIGFGRAFRVNAPDLKIEDHRNDKGHQRG